jgi:hypothetical protein
MFHSPPQQAIVRRLPGRFTPVRCVEASWLGPVPGAEVVYKRTGYQSAHLTGITAVEIVSHGTR